MNSQEIREFVKAEYGQAALQAKRGGSSCCGSVPERVDFITSNLYGKNETEALPAEAVLASLGCGNPTALAELNPGETVLDLGSGGGIDVLLSARRVGPTGKVFGLDMTDEMLALARENQEKAGVRNVEFLKGEIEDIPLGDYVVDVIISNCVINLSPDKARVFRDCFRVLKPGGRLAISDVVAFADIPAHIQEDMALLTGCMAGASLISDLEDMLHDAGFQHVRIAPKEQSKSFIREWAPGTPVTDYVVAATIEAIKPAV